MATITSTATGPWSSGTTWVGGFAPGDGDSAVIADPNVVTVTSNQTVGPGGGAGAVAVTVNQSDSAKLVIADNVTLTVKGDMAFYGRASSVSSRVRLQMGQGSEVKLDTTGGNRQLIFGAGATTLAKLVVTGVSGNRAKFTKIGSNTAGFIQGGNYSLTLSGSYCDVTNYTQDPCIQWPNGLAVVDGTDVVEMDHFDFDGCGSVDMFTTGPLNDMPWTLTNSTIVNSVGGTYSFQYDRQAATGANATVSGNVIDGVASIVPNGITCDDNFFMEANSTSGTGKAASWQRNMQSSNDVGVAGILQDSDFIDCVFWLRNASSTNPHWMRWPGNFDTEVRGCIYDQVSTAGDGDTCVMPGGTPASPVTLTYHYNLRLPTENGGSTGAGTPGGAFSDCAATANADVVCEHNTFFVGDGTGGASGIFLGEHPGGDYPGQCLSYRSNLVWTKYATPTAYHIDSDPANVIHDTDWVAAANAEYNGSLGLSAGSRLGGYNFAGTGSPGAHDVVGVDPAFVDETRNVTTWANSVAGGITTPAQAKALILTANDDGVTGITVPAITTWIRAGFAPTNAAYHNTASDGTDIGAVPFTGPSGIGIPVALFSNPI